MLFQMIPTLAGCVPPVLVIAGDEDVGVIDAAVMLKRTIPRCGLAILPKSGHVTNLEESALFNALVERFVLGVEHGAWGPRDPKSLTASITGAAAPS